MACQELKLLKVIISSSIDSATCADLLVASQSKLLDKIP